MFNDRVFYHSHIRKIIVCFGTLFNNIYIQRRNEDESIAQTMLVPLSYSTKQKMISRIQEAPEFEPGRAKYAITLPRMGFEITSLTYDPARKLLPMQTVRSINSAESGVDFSYVSTPYNMGISMSIYAKNQQDGLQIIEQILPYFVPDFNITINELPSLGIKRDIQFVLDSVNYTDEYQGGFDERLAIVWDLNFTVKMNFFGYVHRAGLIRKVIENIYNNYDANDLSAANPALRITTTPVPADAEPTDDYTFLQEFDHLYMADN